MGLGLTEGVDVGYVGEGKVLFVERVFVEGDKCEVGARTSPRRQILKGRKAHLLVFLFYFILFVFLGRRGIFEFSGIIYLYNLTRNGLLYMYHCHCEYWESLEVIFV